MQLIAYFTATERRLLRWRAGVLHAQARFAADERGLAAWRACLARTAGACLTVVADPNDEEFHEERIPRLRGRDRDAVIERRLEQRFPEGRFVVATSLGAAPGERERESLLLASLTDARRLEAWLDAAHECGVHLAGVTSTAWLVAALLTRHVDRDASGLVISVHAHGLRECFVQERQLRFARFVPGEEKALAEQLRDEAGQLLPYLAARRLLGDGVQALRVTVIAPEAQRAAIELALRSQARLNLQFAAMEQLAGQIGLCSAPADLGAEQLSLALAAKRPPRERFFRRADRRRFVQWRTARALLALGVSAFAVSAAAGGLQWLQLQALRDEARRIRLEAQRVDEPGALRADTAVPLRREAERLAADELRRLAAVSAPPEAALVHLSRALEQHPRIELDALRWSAPATAATGGAMTEPVAQTLEINARIAQPDPRAQRADIARFATALQAASGWQIVRTRLPFDWTPQGTLRGGEDATAGSAAALFTVVIARRLE